jgi:hypothetical protein
MKTKEEFIKMFRGATLLADKVVGQIYEEIRQDAFESGRKEGMTEAMELPASYFGGRKFINAQAIKEARDRKGRT